MLSRASPSWHCSFTSSTSAVSQADGATQSSNAEHSPSSAQGRPVNSRGGSLVGNPESWCLAIASRRRSLRVINWMTNCLTWLRLSSPVPPPGITPSRKGSQLIRPLSLYLYIHTTVPCNVAKITMFVQVIVPADPTATPCATYSCPRGHFRER